MSEVKILKPDKHGILRLASRVKVPGFYSRGPTQPDRKKTNYAKVVRARRHQ